MDRAEGYGAREVIVPGLRAFEDRARQHAADRWRETAGFPQKGRNGRKFSLIRALESKI